MQWRERGLAFELREGLYQTTNPSLLSSRVFSQVRVCFTAYVFYTTPQLINIMFVFCICVSVQKGNKVAVKGYWGDIVSSPYLAFGIQTDDKSLLKTQNGQHIKVTCSVGTSLSPIAAAVSCGYIEKPQRPCSRFYRQPRMSRLQTCRHCSSRCPADETALPPLSQTQRCRTQLLRLTTNLSASVVNGC